MVQRNKNIAKLSQGYLFPEIAKRKALFVKENPHATIISLGIGDTTEPIPHYISQRLQDAAKSLGTLEGYSGYGLEQGFKPLRKSIANVFYHNRVDIDEIFINDGAKCDLGRLQAFFGSEVRVAIQDPAYPVYVDGSVIAAQTGHYNPKLSHYHNITYMPCTPENGFFPDLSTLPAADLIYFCSPNNPTGVVATKEQLKKLVDFAIANDSFIIFDAAYASYIQDPELPRSIYEVEGAKTVAIEVNSFSKMAGFTGVRLGWTVIPNELCFQTGESVKKDWIRYITTIFNGASNIIQAGGIACLEDEGMKEIKSLISFYMENANILKNTLDGLGYKTFSGSNTPYIWADLGSGNSWESFDLLLNKAHIISTPGSGFGPSGEGFIRLSAFGHRNHIEEAAKRLDEHL